MDEDYIQRRSSDTIKSQKYNLPLRRNQTLQLDSHNKRVLLNIQKKHLINLEEKKNIEEKWIRLEEEVKKQSRQVNKNKSNELENLLAWIALLVVFFFALFIAPNQNYRPNH